MVRGNAVGECLFYGAGAGRMPTASAMVADIVDTFCRGNGRKYIDWGPEQPERFVDPNKVCSRWYVRYVGDSDLPGARCISGNGFRAAITEVMDRPALDALLKRASAEAASIFRVLD